MNNLDDIIRNELYRIEKKLKISKHQGVEEEVQVEEILTEKVNVFNGAIDEKINRINKKKSKMKKIISAILIIVFSWGVHKFFLKKNDNIKQMEFLLTTTKISDILKDPRAYQNKKVSVSGKVIQSFSLGFKYYLLNDGTGEIYIIPVNAVPQEKERIKATGIFKQKLKIGNKQLSVIEEE